MKNFTSLFSVIAILTALSCQRTVDLKPVLEAPAYKAVIVEDGRFKFTSPSDYQKAVSDPKFMDEQAKELKLVSNKEGARLGEEKKVPDALKRVLNEDNVVQIGKWIIRLNFDKRAVYVIEEENKASYKSLLSESSSSLVYKFSFDDEVLSLLEDGHKGTPKSSPSGRLAIFCGGGISGGNNGAYTKSISFSCPPTTSGSHISSIEYDKFGIYFECDLQVLAYAVYVGAGQSGAQCWEGGTYDLKYYFRTNCQNYWEGSQDVTGVSYTTNYEGTVPVTGSNTEYRDDRTWRNRIYQGSRGLKCLKVEKFDITPNPTGAKLANSRIQGSC